MSWLSDELVSSSSGNFVVGDDLTVNGNATITLNTVIDDNLTVTNGLVTFSGTGLNVTNGNVVIDDNVTVTNGTVFAGSNVNVTGNVHASNFKAGTTTIGTVAISATAGSFGIYGGAAQNISAFSGGGQASGTNQGSTMDVTVNVCAADYDSIKLAPTGTSGYRFTVRNATSKICRVYPQAGGSIDGVADGYYDLMPGEVQVFRSGITSNAFMSVLNTLQKNVNALGTITHTGTGYGFVHDTGLWEDLRFPAQGINPPGAESDPDRSTVTGLLMFDPDAVETIAGVAQMPHGWKSGTNVVPHIHYMADQATAPSDGANTVLWTFSYAVMDVGEGWDQSTYTSNAVTSTVSAFVSSNAAHQVVDFAEIDMTGKQDSCMIAWKLSRTATNATNDTYADDAHLLELDFHYRANTLGSLAEDGEAF